MANRKTTLSQRVNSFLREDEMGDEELAGLELSAQLHSERKELLRLTAAKLQAAVQALPDNCLAGETSVSIIPMDSEHFVRVYDELGRVIIDVTVDGKRRDAQRVQRKLRKLIKSERLMRFSKINLR